MTIKASALQTEKLDGTLPADVRVVQLAPCIDQRGVFTELFRQSWVPELSFCQWNMVSSAENVLRGVHVHRRHADYLCIASGSCTVGLHDCRGSSATFGQAATILLNAASPLALVIPPGVAHGFYFHTPSIHVYAVTHYWDHDDELGCRFDDPELRITWPSSNVLLSPRDQALPSLRELLPQLQR